MRIRAYEIWNQSSRAAGFRDILAHYFKNIYLAHIAKNPNATPAPYNFWPDSYAFYMCNPIKVFETTIKDIDGDAPAISIDHYVEPHADRSGIVSESMPITILSKQEKERLASVGIDMSSAVSVHEEQRRCLPIRFGKAISHEQKYQRKAFMALSERK